jgi:hypothetical protein
VIKGKIRSPGDEKIKGMGVKRVFTSPVEYNF